MTQSNQHPEAIRNMTRCRRNHLLIHENQLREFTTPAGILVQRREPNEEIRGVVLLNNSPLGEVKPGDTVWFNRSCGEPVPHCKGYILLRYDLTDLVDPTGETDVQSLTEVI